MNDIFADSKAENEEEFSLEEYQVTTHDRLRPVELLGISAVIAIFIGLVVGMATRSWLHLVPISAGIAFVVTLLVIALLMLAIKPNKQDELARDYLDEKSQLGKNTHE